VAAVSVIVPYRGDNGPRDRVWAWIEQQWHMNHPAWEIVVSGPPPGPWRKALAITAAARAASADLLVVADADVWSDDLPAAVEAVNNGAGWAIPHDQVHRLSEVATVDVLERGWPLNQAGPLDQRPYWGHPGGGIVVLHRSTLENVPMDPRFAGWGQEDDSWGLALLALAGNPWRSHQPLWHLWHPPAERLNRQIGSTENEQLYLRYLHARRRPDELRVILDEARECCAAA
jgi:hypothetical protein